MGPLLIVVVALFPATVTAERVDVDFQTQVTAVAQRGVMHGSDTRQTNRSGGAQRPRPAAMPPPTTPPRTAPPTVAPPTFFPFPPLMTPPPGGLIPPTSANPAPNNATTSSQAPFRTRRFLFPSYGGGYYSVGDPGAAMPSPPAAAAIGWLRLAVTPLAGQVFVDGYYVATVADINAQGALTLDAGPHRVEIRADGYQALTFDIRIAARDTVTYRGALDIVRPPAPAAPAATAPQKMYVIPRCYIGNVPPRAGRLPQGCNIGLLEVLGPK